MLSCDGCQKDLLSFLYDLLEPQERHELATHLETCASCQAALQIAREQQGLLSEAVKEVHADIVFKAPVKAAPASTQPTVVLASVRRRRLLLNRWAIAASVLFLLFGAAALAGWSVMRHDANRLAEAQTRVAKAKSELEQTAKDVNAQKAQSQQEIRAIQEQIDALFKNWQEDEIKTRQVLKDQQTTLIINGPQIPRAGVRNSYVAELRQQNGSVTNTATPLPRIPNPVNEKAPDQAKAQQAMQARVVDQNSNTILYQQDLNFQNNNRANFDLPSNLAIKPGANVAWEFTVRSDDGKEVLLRDKLNVVFPEYVTYLSTDRPIYRPGDTLRFRSLTLDRFSLKPAEETFRLLYRIVGPNNVEIFKQEADSQVVSGPARQPIKGPDGQPLRGLGAGECILPANLPEGKYSLIVSETSERFREEKRSFTVHRWQTPRFDKEVTFDRPFYGPGDIVKVKVRISPAQSLQAFPNAPVQMNVNARGQMTPSYNSLALIANFRVDGADIQTLTVNTDNNGRAALECRLPVQMVKGIGTLTIECKDGGIRETLVRAIPLVLRDLRVEFFPEGGELIAGVPNRVYFQARTPAGKPIDLQGRIVDHQNKEIVRIQTLTDEREPGLNQGFGSFTFTPQPQENRIYVLHVDSPIGINRTITLPGAKTKGLALHLGQGVVDNEIPITLYSIDKARDLLIGAYCRGRLLDHAFVKTDPRKPTEVKLKPAGNVAGVYRITVFEKVPSQGDVAYRPLAERLTYRKNTETVDIALKCDKRSYQPGGRVQLSLDASDEKHQPASCVAMVAVVDAGARKRADDRTPPSMPTHFLLTTEIRDPEDLENADVLLGDHPRAAEALDLLLGCQGWRRFAEQDPERFQRVHGQAKMPVFLANSDLVPQFLDAEQKQIDKLDQQYVAKAIELERTLAEKEKSAQAPVPLKQRLDLLQQNVANALRERDEADGRFLALRAFILEVGWGAAPLILLLIGFFLVSVGLRRLSEGRHARTWFTCGLSLLALVFVASIIGTFTLMGVPMDLLHNQFGAAFGRKAPAPVWVNPDPNPGPVPAGAGDALIDEAVEDDQEKLVVRAQLEAMKKFDPAIPVLPPAQIAAINEQQQMLGMQRVADRDMPWVPEERQDRVLRHQGNYQGLIQKQLGRRVQLPTANDPSIVREYAHQHPPTKDEVRPDFAETIYWHPALVLAGGKGEVQFDLCDAVTRYDVLVLSHTLDGRLGANRLEIDAKLPFTFEPRVPEEVSSSDQITIPVAINNEQATRISATLSERAMGLNTLDNAERGLNLNANQQERELFKVTPSITQGAASVRFAGKTAGARDVALRRLQVMQDGFPVIGSSAGVLENNVELPLTLPNTWIPGSLEVQARFYPSPLAELQAGLDALLREPAACFEQSAATNYAGVMILNRLKETGQRNPFAEKRARNLLQAGYGRLASFECADPGKADVKGGFEWFGQTAPPQPALTAYALVFLHELAKFYPVDPGIIDRTEKYLLDQRDHVGGFKRSSATMDRPPVAISSAYIVWALTEVGTRENLDTELSQLRAQCKDCKDPYFLALVALSHLNAKKNLNAGDLLKKLRDFQRKDGRVDGAEESITGSHGRDLQVETTSLATLGWLKAQRPEFDPNLHKAHLWLCQQRQPAGNFGATQATILALKAQVAYAQQNVQPLPQGVVQMKAVFPAQDSGKPMRGQQFRPEPAMGWPNAVVAPRSPDVLTLDLRDPEMNLGPGKNRIQLSLTGGNSLPYVLSWSYRTAAPDNAARAPVRLTAKLGAEQAREGETVKLTATIENRSGKAQGMTVAVLGLPAGLALPEGFQQLKEYARWEKDGIKLGKIRAWELRGRELVLYWRDLAPEAKIAIDLDLVCRLPGQYRGPPSRAYLYYNPDIKFWHEPLGINISPAERAFVR